MPTNKKKKGNKKKKNAPSSSSSSAPTPPPASAPQVMPYRTPNDLPRVKVFAPHLYREQEVRLHPLNCDGIWFFMDGDYYIRLKDNKNKLPPIAGHCPVCFKPADKTCIKCNSVSYCSAECQRKHWSQSHKKVCQSNPNLYEIKLSLEPLIALPNQYHKGYEFLLIKPTAGPEPSLQDICENVLESADHIMDIPGFGTAQIQVLWPVNNTGHALQKQICDTFGWTSGVYGVELVEGYRIAEDIFVYMVLNDDNFQSDNRMLESYYGGSIYPSVVRNQKHVRGNLVIYKIMTKNKKWLEYNNNSSSSPVAMFIQCGDDANLQFEFEMYPTSKLEIALLLQERRKAIEMGAYTRRMWRSVLRVQERQIEVTAQNNNGSFLSL